jgi:hypothetical protein
VLSAVDLEVRLKRGPKRGFGILYLAAHGLRGQIELDGGLITLEELSGMMKRRYEGWAVHFGSCLVMGAPLSDIKAFKRETGAALVSGYEFAVEWIQSSAFEMIWLSVLIQGKNRLPKYGNSLAETTGFLKI